MKILFSLVLLGFLCGVSAAAPLSGRITAAAGVDVSDILMTAVNTSNGDVRQTMTDAQGLYSFPDLATGVLQQVSPARVGYGFSPAVRFVQHNGQTANVDFEAFAGPFSKTATSGDFDGDGMSDPAVFRAADATWYIAPSKAGTPFYGVRWGLASDVAAPADYDGDGKTDLAVWRAADASRGNKSYFYILNSADDAVRIEEFGLPNDRPFLAGDWDGDGRADPAVYRDGAQGFFYFRGSFNNPGGNITFLPWGAAGDRPVRGDFDGDGRLDAAVFRPANGTWYIQPSGGGAPLFLRWGIASDQLVPADYDGDGVTDAAVFREGVWYVRLSSNEQPRYVRWGLATDQPVPADYDGDGLTDLAVRRGSLWYVLESLTDEPRIFSFGLASDAPAQAAAFGN